MMINLVLFIATGLSFTTFQITDTAFEIESRLPAIFNTSSIVRYFGESCDTTHQCNVKETLACINGTCECSDSSSMIFDPSRGLCVGKAGQRCLLHPIEVTVPPSKRIGSCVTSASCELDDLDGVKTKNSSCRCWSSFYPDNSTGLCLRRHEYLQNCENHEQCNNRKGLICNGDIRLCTCDTTIHRYNPDSERCVGLPNRDCGNVYSECTENHKCKAGICRCKYKEVEAINGTILCDPVRHKYGKACGRFRGDCGDESINNLRCLDGKCRCKNPDYQTYDHDRRMCVSKVGGPCTIAGVKESTSSFRNNSKFNSNTFPHIQCISYAHCVEITPKTTSKSALRGVCECGESYIETKKGSCSLPFGSDCDTSPKNKKDECATPLKCVSSRCACPNEVDVYEPQTKKCSKSIRSLCWKDSSCVQNAVCKKPSKNMPGRCTCLAKFKTTSLATCA